MNNIGMQLPSRNFCLTGRLDLGEIYDQNIHSGAGGKTPYERCGYYGYYGDDYIPNRAAYGAGTKKIQEESQKDQEESQKIK